jgi:hypothetical protein
LEEIKMTDNKNMMKKNNRAYQKVVAKKKFYGIVEYKVTTFDAKGKKSTTSKSGVLGLDEKMSRLQAKRELARMAKSMGAKLVYFGVYGQGQ